MKNKAVVFVIAVGLLLAGVALLLGPSVLAAPSEDAAYVGASKCKKCHSKEVRQWKKTAHAKNFEILTMMGRDKDGDCVKCHSTGFGKPSGFVDIETTPNLAGTTCEACHGPASEHITVNPKEKERARATISLPTGPCVQCHNPHEVRKMEAGKDALPVLKKKLEELQARIAELEAQ